MNVAVNDAEYLRLIDQLNNKVDKCLSVAEQKFQKSFEYQSVQINLKGRAAGQIKYVSSLNGKLRRDRSNIMLPVLRFNPYLLAKYKEEFIEQVVPHECAHLVAYALFGMNIKPHGAEWKALMNGLYKLKPAVTHNFEVPMRTKPKYSYHCGCPEIEHQITIIRHNKVLKKNAIYLCKQCRSPLKYNA